MTGAVEIQPVAGRAGLERFLRVPWPIYRRDPNWVPPLLSDVRKVLDASKHPFHAHGEVATFLAVRDGVDVGRIAAVTNRSYTEFQREETGFFGLFESIDDQAVADALLRTAEQWLRERGLVSVLGPMNLSTNEEVCSPGVLIDGFHRPPAILMAHTPPYYARLLERSGYEKAKDLVCYWLEGREPPPMMRRGYDRLLRDGSVTVRSLNMRRLDAEIAIVKELYNSAWERNWGFTPMTEAELANMVSQLKPVVNPSLCAIAEVDGEPVGFAVGLPDYNVALRHVNGRLLPTGIFKLLWHRRGMDKLRIITLGTRPEFRHRGFDSLLMTHVFMEGNKAGFWRGECSWILEDNQAMRRVMERIGGVADKTYRVYGRSL